MLSLADNAESRQGQQGARKLGDASLCIIAERGKAGLGGQANGHL